MFVCVIDPFFINVVAVFFATLRLVPDYQRPREAFAPSAGRGQLSRARLGNVKLHPLPAGFQMRR